MKIDLFSFSSGALLTAMVAEILWRADRRKKRRTITCWPAKLEEREDTPKPAEETKHENTPTQS